MAAAVYSHRSVVARSRSPILPPSCASSVRINTACVARPEDAAKDAKRRHRRDEEPPKSPPVKRRRRDDPRAASPADRRRKRESFSSAHDCRRVSSSGSSFSRIRAALSVTGADVHARRAAKRHDGDRAHEARRRSGSGSSRSESRARSDPPAEQRQLPAPIERSSSAALDRRPPLEKMEMAGDAEARRRRDIQCNRDEARREMDKVVRTVEFNDPFISPLDVLKRWCAGRAGETEGSEERCHETLGFFSRTMC